MEYWRDGCSQLPRDVLPGSALLWGVNALCPSAPRPRARKAPGSGRCCSSESPGASSTPRGRCAVLRASNGEPASWGKALGPGLKAACCGWTGRWDSRNSRAGRSHLSVFRGLAVTSQLPFPPSGLEHTGVLPEPPQQAGSAHTWVPHCVPVLWVGRCPVCSPQSQRPPAASDSIKVFQLCAHWKCLHGIFSCLLFLCGQILSTCCSHCRWRPAIS